MLQTADKTLHKAVGKPAVDIVVEFQENKAGNWIGNEKMKGTRKGKEIKVGQAIEQPNDNPTD